MSSYPKSNYSVIGACHRSCFGVLVGFLGRQHPGHAVSGAGFSFRVMDAARFRADLLRPSPLSSRSAFSSWGWKRREADAGPHGEDQVIQLGSHDGFLFQQEIRQFVEDIDVLLQHRSGPGVGTVDEVGDFAVDEPGRLVGIVPVLCDLPAEKYLLLALGIGQRDPAFRSYPRPESYSRAISVACLMSLDAPVLILLKMISSAARPPYATASSLSSWSLYLKSCSSGRNQVTPAARPRGIMVILLTHAEYGGENEQPRHGRLRGRPSPSDLHP